MIMNFCGHTLWFFVVLLIALNQHIAADYCSSQSPLSKIFSLNEKVYLVTKSGLMFTFDLRSKVVSSAANNKAATKLGPQTLDDVAIVVHFDPVGACDPAASNAQFCEHSKVFAGAVALIDGDKNMSMLWYNGKRKAFEAYSHRAEFTKARDILPSINSRLYSAIYLVFEQVARSADPRFTAGTYDQFTDSLYLAATISDGVAQLPEWGVGKYVLFRANFAPNGLVQDSFVVAKFDHPVTGLSDFNGDLFVLTKNNVIHQLGGNESLKVEKTFDSADLFCKSSSPLKAAIAVPSGQHRTSSFINIQNLGQLFFPHAPNELKFVDSALLTGGTFILIVVVLSALLVVIVVVDVYIVYSMSQETGEDEKVNYGDDDYSTMKKSSRRSSGSSSSSSSGRRSSSSSRSSKRSKSKSKSRSLV